MAVPAAAEEKWMGGEGKGLLLGGTFPPVLDQSWQLFPFPVASEWSRVVDWAVGAPYHGEGSIVDNNKPWNLKPI